MNKEFILALEQLEKEKQLSRDILIEAIESALVSAYKKNYGTSENIRVNVDNETGDVNVYMKKEIVEEVDNELMEVSIEEAKSLDEDFEIGEFIEYQVTPKDFGRIAAQTAKQVVMNRLREAEREKVFSNYETRKGEILSGEIHRMTNGIIFVSLGSSDGIIAQNEQVEGEKYRIGQRIKAYLMDIKRTPKGPMIYLSRSHPGFVRKLFEIEVPEIEDGTVLVKSIAREAGSRTKIAVWSEDEAVDPIGSCVGSGGSRVQNVADEIFGEKIDIVEWDEDPEILITRALSPAKVEKVLVFEDSKSAIAIVPDKQLSLAIGKEGQNVRLAAKVTGWKIDIKSHTKFYDEYEEDEILYRENSEIEEPQEIEHLEETETIDEIDDEITEV